MQGGVNETPATELVAICGLMREVPGSPLRY